MYKGKSKRDTKKNDGDVVRPSYGCFGERKFIRWFQPTWQMGELHGAASIVHAPRNFFLPTDATMILSLHVCIRNIETSGLGLMKQMDAYQFVPHTANTKITREV